MTAHLLCSPLPCLGLLLAATSAVAGERAAQTPHRLGDHPAVVVQRLARVAPYDYAAKFYPHPAWLWLCDRAPVEADAAQAEILQAAALAARRDSAPATQD